MDDEKYQKELFEFEKPKHFLPRLSDIFPKADFERNIALTLTLDKVVFIAIGIIMVMVVVYALGVEAGKHRAVISNNQVQVSAGEPVQAKLVTQPVSYPVNKQLPAQALPVTKMQPQALPVHATVSRTVLPPAISKSTAISVAPVKNNGSVPVAQIKPVTIVAVTLVSKESAMREFNKLKNIGFLPVLVRNDKYFQVCVGTYTDKNSAQSQSDLKKVRRLYKDAYLKGGK